MEGKIGIMKNSQATDKIMSQQHMSRKIWITLCFCVLAILFYIFNLYNMNELILNSDMANMVLEADDILHGNFFLKDWNLTGISFLTTDLLYFTLSVAICGVSSKAYILTVASMFFMLVLASCFLLEDKHKVLGIVVLFVMSCFPDAYYKASLSIHTACFAWCFWSLYFLCTYYKNKKRLYFCLSFACLTLATCGDSISILLMVLPLAAISIYDFFFRKEPDIWRDKQQIILAGGASVLGIVLEKTYLAIGGANKNAYISSTHFVKFDDLPEKLGVFFSSLFRLMDADYTTGAISDITSLIRFIRAAIVIVGIAISILQIANFITGGGHDFISLALSIGFFSVMLICSTTSLSVDAGTARYYVFAPCLLGIIIARFISQKIVKKRQIALCGVICACLLITIFPIGNFCTDKTNEGYGSIINTLEENNLKNGYSTFWTSSVMSVASEGNVTVRHITQDKEGIHPMSYFSKNSWYDEYANFIIINPGEQGLDKDMLINILGNPMKVINAEGYELLIWDKDISDKLTNF